MPVVFFLFTCGCIFTANKNTNEDNLSIKLSKLIFNNVKIDSLLNVVISDNRDYLNSKDCFLLMNYFQDENDTNYVCFMPYKKEEFTITCSKNDYSILGYFDINNQTVLLVGDTCFDEMKFSDEKKIFTFNCQEEPECGTVPPPPSMYNPPVYTFLYEK